MAICCELCSRRSRDLAEDETTDPFGVTGKERIDRAQTVDNTLGIVEAFNADTYPDRLAQPQFRANRGAACSHRFLVGEGCWRPFYRDWIGPHEGFMAADGHRSELAINSALDKTIDGLDKIVAVELRTELPSSPAMISPSPCQIPKVSAF